MSLLLRILVYTLLLVPLTASLWPIWPLQTAVPDGSTLLLTTLIGGVGLLQIKNATIHIPLPALFLVALLGSAIISGWFGDYQITTSLLWQLITLTALLLATLGLGRLRAHLGDEEYVLILARGLLSLGLIYSLASVAIYYGVFHGLPHGQELDSRLGGLWRQPNLTATTVWLALTVGLLAHLHKASRQLTIGFVLLVGLICALTASRVVILFVIISVVLGCIATRSRHLPIKRQGLWLATVSGIVFVSLLAMPPAVRFIEQQTGYSTNESITLMDRHTDRYPRLVEHAKIASSMPDWTARQWLIGVGPGNYGDFSYQHPIQPEDGAGAQGGWLHSHNILSMILVEQGIVGLSVIILVFASITIGLWRNRSRTYALPIAAGLAILILHSNVEFPLWYPWFAFVFVAFSIPLFGDMRIQVESLRLISCLGTLIVIVAAVSAVNIGSQAVEVAQVSKSSDPDLSDYRTIQRVGTGSLLGPYATLTGYQQFSPSMFGLDSQIQRSEAMADWRPVGVIKVRQTMLLLRAGDPEAACHIARETAAYYPTAGPLIIERAIMDSSTIKLDLAHLVACVESGLAMWGEDLGSIDTSDDHDRAIW